MEVARRDADGHGPDPQTYAWDAHGRLERAARGGRVVTYSYDASDRVATRGDGTGRTLGYAWDDADRLIRVDRPGGSSTRYAYDRNGNRTKVAMPGGDEHVLGYTSVDRLRRYDPPDRPPASSATGTRRAASTRRRCPARARSTGATTLRGGRPGRWIPTGRRRSPTRGPASARVAVARPGRGRARSDDRPRLRRRPAHGHDVRRAGGRGVRVRARRPRRAHGDDADQRPGHRETALTRDLDGELTGIGPFTVTATGRRAPPARSAAPGWSSTTAMTPPGV